MTNPFWSKVQVGKADECWPYLGPRSGGRDGRTYGSYSRSRKAGGRRTFSAHRMAFCIANGINIDDLPPSVIIRHRCDNPVCCNPGHLEDGTQADNANDMSIRGRSLRGEQGTSVVLTEAQVHQIRQRLEAGERQADIADSYGVSRPTISLIKSGKTWGWLKPPANDNATITRALDTVEVAS